MTKEFIIIHCTNVHPILLENGRARGGGWRLFIIYSPFLFLVSQQLFIGPFPLQGFFKIMAIFPKFHVCLRILISPFSCISCDDKFPKIWRPGPCANFWIKKSTDIKTRYLIRPQTHILANKPHVLLVIFTMMNNLVMFNNAWYKCFMPLLFCFLINSKICILKCFVT